MVVVTSRQTGLRPETIRTRLARFMPKGPAAGWSVAWSAHAEWQDEIDNEDELRAGEHLGCYGAAVAHALAQAEVAAVRLRVSAEVSAASGNGTPRPITLEVRAQIPGPAVDPGILQTIVRRAEPQCSVWNSLAADAGVQVVVILDEPTAAESTQQASEVAPASRVPAGGSRLTAAQPVFRGPSLPALPRLGVPGWLTLRMVGLLAVALGALVMAHPWTMV